MPEFRRWITIKRFKPRDKLTQHMAFDGLTLDKIKRQAQSSPG